MNIGIKILNRELANRIKSTVRSLPQYIPQKDHGLLKKRTKV